MKVALSMRVVAGPPGEDRDALSQDWCRFFDAHGLMPVPVPNALSDPVAFIETMGVAALLLSGGNDLDSSPYRDRTESLLLAHAIATGLPTFGVDESDDPPP